MRRALLASLVLFALLLLAPGLARAAPLPPIEHPVEDLAGVLDAPTKQALTTRLTAAKQRAEIAVLLVRTTGGTSIDDYSLAVARAWRGGQSDAVLIVLAIDDHRSRIQVSTGLAGQFPDARCKAALDGSRDLLRKSDYGGAVSRIVDQLLAPSTGTPTPPTPAREATAADFMLTLFVLLVLATLLLFPILVFVIVFVGIARALRGARRAGGHGSAGFGGYSNDSSWSSSDYGSSDFGSSGSDFGSSGSDFGSSGGDFGGGGASSSW